MCWILLNGWCASQTTQHTHNTNQFKNDREGSLNQTLTGGRNHSNNDLTVLAPVTPNSTGIYIKNNYSTVTIQF